MFVSEPFSTRYYICFMLTSIYHHIKKIGLINFALLFGYLVNPLNYGFVFGYVMILIIVLKSKFIKNNLDLDFLIITLFTLIYGLFYAINPADGIQFIIIYTFTPPFLYLWGKYFSAKLANGTPIFFALIIMGFLFSISALISILLNIAEGGFVQHNRSIPMFWSDLPLSATKMGSYLTFNMCIPAILLSSSKKLNTITKILLTTTFVLSLICALRLGSRTQLVVMLATFLFALVYIFPKQTLKQNITVIFLLLIGIFFVFRNVSFDLNADWMTSFAGRMEGGTSEMASGGGRTERWVKSFQYMFTDPLGWDLQEFGYAHNLWLDVLRAGGIIPFLILIIYSVRSFFQIKKIYKISNHISLNSLVYIYALAFLLLFMVEPIIEGVFPFFVLFCLYKGAINQHFMAQVN